MRGSVFRLLMFLSCAASFFAPAGRNLVADELAAQDVTRAIDKARTFLLGAQQADGSWSGAAPQHNVGASSLALLALLNTGMTVADPPVQRGFDWLRRQKPGMTYDISLMIQALAAARDGDADRPRVTDLVERLEESQIGGGPNAGSWTYNKAGRRGDKADRSNCQFAVLALRDAREMGVPVRPSTWRAARNHWLGSQNGDGSWGYTGGRESRGGSGSMTVAGIAALIITEAMLKAESSRLNPDGTPDCCADPENDMPLDDACRWLGSNFSVAQNPGGHSWLTYYLYGLERAGRVSGRRFFVGGRGQKHDWYRRGAEFLVHRQSRLDGSWRGDATGESHPVIATSFALMFLSKGLAPVLINKLEYGSRAASGQVAGRDWNLHKDDVRNLTQMVGSLPKYPRLVTWQTVDASQADLADLLQAPILFIGGSEAPQLAVQEVALLKEYILHGGLIFVCNNCHSAAFDEGFRDLVGRLGPAPEARLTKLPGEHPVYRSEFNLLDEATGTPTVEYWGVDVGCRTSIIYSPEDLSCLWDKWTGFEVFARPPALSAMIARATRAGANVVSYATGRRILNKMERQDSVPGSAAPDRIERDLLQISKIRYAGDWDAAPQALKNLLVALGTTSGAAVSPRQRDLTLADQNLFRYPIAYMHGRYEFALGKNEQEKLREYINQGGVLFSDACCGFPDYDRSFRRLMEQLFPENPLKRIPADHQMFSARIGHDLKTVRLRAPEPDNAGAPGPATVRDSEPFLEGIEINGRFVVIYSKHDISCALEGGASAACTGYVPEDAVKIGVNVLLYALLQ
jgi:hypothetical protein